MVKGVYESIKVDVRDKSRNPFIGAFIFIWVIRNWEAVYTFFYFDKELSREERIKILNDYFINYGVWELFVTIGLALVAIVTSFVLLNITKAIVNLFEKRVTPKILDLTGFDDVVPTSVYEATEELNSQLQRKVKELKAEIAEVKLENEDLEKRLVTAQSEEQKILKFGKTLQDATNAKDDPVLTKRNNALAKKIVEQMPDNLLFTFLKIAAEVKKDQPIDLNVNMKPFVEDKIFQEVKEIPSGRYTFYKVTPFGELAIKYAQERNDNRVNPMDSDYLA